MTQDEEHLKYLAIGHYAVGGLGALFGLFPLLHVIVGLFMASGAFEGDGQGPPVAVGLMFVVIGLTLIAFLEVCAVGVILSGRFIGQKKNYLYSLVVGGVLCIFFPVGTVLGVLTILVLSKDSVKDLYGRQAPDTDATVSQ